VARSSSVGCFELGGSGPQLKGRLQEKIAVLRAQMEQLTRIEARMNALPDKQVSPTAGAEDSHAEQRRRRRARQAGRHHWAADDEYRGPAGSCAIGPLNAAEGRELRIVRSTAANLHVHTLK
jgi:hypothetical protein